METQVFLKKSGREVFLMRWRAQATCPWDQSRYERVLIPFTDKELIHARSGKRAHVQIINNQNLRWA